MKENKFQIKIIIMKKTGLILVAIVLLFTSLNAQYFNVIKVPPGTTIIEKFPPSVRYLHPQFSEGKVFNTAGTENTYLMNYNLLTKEIEFIQNTDTLAISRKRDIERIILIRDTFVYRNEYLKKINSGKLIVLEKDGINLKEIVKIGAMGQPNRTANVDAYTAMPYMSNLYVINPDVTLEFRRELQFYILTSKGEMVEIRKKTLLELYPDKEAEIQKFLKANKIKFEEKEDILKLADFLGEM